MSCSFDMRSIGIDLEPWVNKRLLRFETLRTRLYGLEMHLTKMYQAIREFESQAVKALNLEGSRQCM